MKDDIAIRVLEMNFLEFLAGFLEGRVKLPVVFQINERIYNRDHTLLSDALITVTSNLHELKLRIDNGERLDKNTIMNTINDTTFVLVNGQKSLKLIV